MASVAQIKAYHQGRQDARDGNPCEPWQRSRSERTAYARGHASIKATVSSANMLGLVFVEAGL